MTSLAPSECVRALASVCSSCVSCRADTIGSRIEFAAGRDSALRVADSFPRSWPGRLGSLSRAMIHHFAPGHALQLHVAPLQHGHHQRIEASSVFLGDSGHSHIDGQSPAIGAVRCQRIQTVHCRKNPRADRNLFRLESARITRAIPLFMMGGHDLQHRLGEVHARQHIRPAHRMGLHLLPLFRR